MKREDSDDDDIMTVTPVASKDVELGEMKTSVEKANGVRHSENTIGIATTDPHLGGEGIMKTVAVRVR